jgi:hypothetical protein
MESKNNFKNIELGDLKSLQADMNFGEKLDSTEIFGIRLIIAILLVVIVFAGFSAYITKINENMKQKVETNISEQEKEIAKINADKQSINERKEEYSNLLRRLSQKPGNNNQEQNTEKDSIPNLLTSIANLIPKNLTITKIVEKNRRVTITAQSSTYEQFGYFLDKLKDNSIITNVVTTKENKANGILEFKLEGDLTV